MIILNVYIKSTDALNACSGDFWGPNSDTKGSYKGDLKFLEGVALFESTVSEYDLTCLRCPGPGQENS